MAFFWGLFCPTLKFFLSLFIERCEGSGKHCHLLSTSLKLFLLVEFCVLITCALCAVREERQLRALAASHQLTILSSPIHSPLSEGLSPLWEGLSLGPQLQKNLSPPSLPLATIESTLTWVVSFFLGRFSMGQNQCFVHSQSSLQLR